MSYKELESLIFKVWLNTEDIRKLANNCCRDTAIKIRNNVENKILESGYELFDSKEKVVPTKWVLDYLGLDIDYIVNMAKLEKTANDLGNDYGNILQR